MRNLLEYPITSEEVVQWLKRYPVDERAIGGNDGFIKAELVEFFENEPAVMTRLLNHMQCAVTGERRLP